MGKVVGIDCFKLSKGYGKSIGIYTFAEKIIQHVANKNRDCKWVVFGNKDNAPFFNLGQTVFVEVPFNYRNKIICVIWELFLVKYYIKKYDINTILFPRGFAPVGNKKQSAIVVHDMIPFYYHKYFPKALNRYENFYIMWRLKTSIKKSRRVITISDYSKQEIERIVPERKDDVQVIYHGYDSIRLPILIEPEITGDYILAVTSKLPHKNAIGVLKAYEAYYDMAESPAKLVVVGIDSIDDYYADMNSNVKKSVICKPFLKDDIYYSLYYYAKAFLFLSLTEGFGLPPLEAMQFRLPCVVSNYTCLPDIVGNGALLVNPVNVKEVANAIQTVLTDEGVRKDLIAQGIDNLKRFDWETQICKYIKLLEEA